MVGSDQGCANTNMELWLQIRAQPVTSIQNNLVQTHGSIDMKTIYIDMCTHIITELVKQNTLCVHTAGVTCVFDLFDLSIIDFARVLHSSNSAAACNRKKAIPVTKKMHGDGRVGHIYTKNVLHKPEKCCMRRVPLAWSAETAS